MSWTARITAAPGGNLRLLFPEPVRHIDMDQATARHFATLIATASERKRSTANEATIELLDAFAKAFNSHDLEAIYRL